MDGFAYAGEALVGRYIGADNQMELHRTVHRLFTWGADLSVTFTLLYDIGGQSFLSLLTNETPIIDETETYFHWVLAIPLAGFSVFFWDGILIGVTAIHQMPYSIFIASANSLTIYYIFHNSMGDHALWMVFVVYFSLRGFIRALLARKTMQQR